MQRPNAREVTLKILRRVSDFVSSPVCVRTLRTGREVANDYIRTFSYEDGCDGSFAARIRRL